MKLFGILLLAIALAGCATKSSTATPPATLTITAPTTLPEAVTGQPYTFTMTAAGGVPPYSWTLVSSSIPKTAITPGGVLTLTPQHSTLGMAPAEIEVTVTDSASTQLALKLN